MGVDQERRDAHTPRRVFAVARQNPFIRPDREFATLDPDQPIGMTLPCDGGRRRLTPGNGTRGADARATGLRMIGGHGIPNIKLERLYSTQPIGATLRARLVIE